MGPLRTDLAMEAFENAESGVLSGVKAAHWETGGIQVTEVEILENAAARQLGKPKGRYLTLESPLLRQRDPDARLAMSRLLGEEIAGVLPEAGDGPVLVVGLGNRAITPDALGPGVIDRTLVTRHLRGRAAGPMALASVCALSPGVMGVTGIETMELIRSLCRDIAPRAVICVDSLAARDFRRIGSAFQLTDTGIQPGSGVGNHRAPLTGESLGVPVVSVGMPTVIYAATLARDAFAWLCAMDGDGEDRNAALADMEQTLLGAEIGGMIVTPREIDAIVQDAAGIIASGINRALQPTLSDAEIAAMME